jgi:PAS domain S-box-containing protein
LKSLFQFDKFHQESVKIVIIYILFGCAWIYLSDKALNWLVRDPEVITKISIFKGLFFIIFTSVLLFFLTSRMSGKIKQSTNALMESEARLQLLVKNASDALVIVNADGSQRYVSPAAERITGFSVAELEGRQLETLIHPDDMNDVRATWREAVEHPDKTVTVPYRHIHKLQEWVFFEATAQSFLHEPAINGVIASVRDITERKRAEEENSKLQEQLTQAQKMESVGRLAGGVAHDFNNMLGVILGHAEMALEQLNPTQPLYTNLQEISMAAKRSADLTQQLLTFARKQTVAPKVLDLNKTVEKMITMLRRLIGEDINLVWLPGENIRPVKMDPSQIDQILANLCVNARDAISAISDMGEVTIKTDLVTFDESYCAAHAGYLPGEYIQLSVNDNGNGMDRETLPLLFEPFFTTKGIGKGTGLGLATIYGIVKQNNGFINVESEPGKGATFDIYLPPYDGEIPKTPKEDIANQTERGHETILLVEDEPMILNMTKTMLKHHGYKVLHAASPFDAIFQAKEHAGEIHLLITDVVMPEMNGRDLAEKLVPIVPNLKCLFMSGYTADVIAHHSVLDKGVHFIQKPFSLKDLTAKVRETLDK